jgi:isopenicillin-N epimerase
MLEAFGLDPQVLHLNHGAFGAAPVAVRQVAAAWRVLAERNPHRFNRTDVRRLVARERAAAFLGIDRITSPTATVVPVRAVAAAVAGTGARVLVDAAHAPGQLDDDIAALGADHWAGNLRKWAYAQRGSAILWSRPGAEVTPAVLSWQLEDGYAASFDYPGTWDYAGWLAAGDGLAYWESLGGRDTVSRLADMVAAGQRLVADATGVTLERLPDGSDGRSRDHFTRRSPTLAT